MEALGVGIGLKTVCIVGGIDMFQQVGCCPFGGYILTGGAGGMREGAPLLASMD